ncbi:hypothetical protein JYT76_03410 [Olleya sp. AH-315-F22]|nr:hypothetical protein [Olleya sp. AH-315-F22]
MIKFFRRMRYDHMEKNKTGKYFKYAIGEIVLVVIGILIAISINNWNQGRLDKLQAIGYLKNLVEDLKSDTIQFNKNIKSYKFDMANNSTPLLNDDYKMLDVDSIIVLINGYWQINRTSDQTFQKIKNAGLIEILGTEEINKAVNDYYNLEISNYEYFIERDKEYTDRDSDFWFHNSSFESTTARNYNVKSLPFKDSPAKRKAELVKLIESTQGRNYLRNAIVRDEYGINKVKITKSAAKNLLILIDKEINK